MFNIHKSIKCVENWAYRFLQVFRHLDYILLNRYFFKAETMNLIKGGEDQATSVGSQTWEVTNIEFSPKRKSSWPKHTSIQTANKKVIIRKLK